MFESTTASSDKDFQHVALRTQKLETIGMLAAGVVHDFRNVLTVMECTLSLLRNREMDETHRHGLIEEGSRSLIRGKSLAQRLLQLSREEVAASDTVCFLELIRSLEPMFKAAVGPLASVEFDIAPGLPLIRVDRNRLELTLLNLVINARDAMPDGGVVSISTELVQSCSAGSPSSYLHLTVQDTGKGMDEGTLAHACDLLFTTKGLGEGTGLGLWSVRKFVTDLGGNFELSSILGIGTTAELWFPVLDGRPSPDASPFPDA